MSPMSGSGNNGASVVGRPARGFTFVELAMCLALIAVASVGISALFGTSTEASMVLDTQARASAISQMVPRSYASGRGFSASTTHNAHAEGWLPESTLGTNGRAANAWGHPFEYGHRDGGQVRPVFTLTQSAPA